MEYQSHQVDVNWENAASNDSDDTKSTSKGTKRSRITRACDICRRKKIKCDIDDSKQCSACKQYGWECTFNDTTKKRGPPKGYIESLENRLKKMEVLLEQMNSEGGSGAALEDEAEKKSPIQLPKAIEHNKVVRYLGSSSGYYLVRNILSTEEKEIEEVDVSRRPSICPNEAGSLRFRKINVVDDDIMFVRDKTLAEHVDQVKSDKLDLKPDIIPNTMVDQLVRRYFQMDHACMPVVDKEPFMDSYEGKTEPPPATILVYAICTRVCTLLEKEDPIFKNAGRERDEVHDALLDYTSTLAKREYLIPRTETIQALILLCSYPLSSDSFYKVWLRAGMAVRMAQELGLHRTLERLPLSEKSFEARKRLWYCVYITDRWVCAVLGRPLAVADADCDIDLPHVNGGSQASKDYSIFINFIKLSGILGEVLRRIYSPRAKAQGYNNKTAYHAVQSIYRLLSDWFQQLPDHQRISTEEAKTFYQDSIKTNKVKEAGPLMVCYYTVIILLYRTFLVSDKQDVLPELFDEANRCCTEAAKNAIDIARLISPSEIICFGWSFAGYGIFQASLIHIYNCTNNSPEIAQMSKHYVKICIEECLRPITSGDVGITPHHILPLIKTLIHLSGADKENNSNTSSATTSSTSHTALNHQERVNNTNYNAPVNMSNYASNVSAANHVNNNPYTTFNINNIPMTQPQQPPAPIQTASPMSVHSILSSDWNKSSNDTNTPPIPAAGSTVGQETTTSAVPWQNLFSSAATPFFDSDTDLQNALSMFFDENQIKQANMFF